ncbi:MAG: MFS transporter [Desulfobacterales bacterium]
MAEPLSTTGKWINRNILGFGLTSLLSDFCHEMATAVLPQFIQAIGVSAAALGFIEGVADALSSFAKLGSGYWGDKTGNRKKWTVFGYALTGVSKALFAFAFSWPLILIGRAAGWLGRGLRGPLRDAMLADSVTKQNRGKAFGFNRTGDTVGAVMGPLAAYLLLSLMARHTWIAELPDHFFTFLSGVSGSKFRFIFLLTLIPGLLSVASMVFLVKEKTRSPNHELRFMGVIRAMPKEYRMFLFAVGVFGMADFAPTFMILRATTVLGPDIGFLKASQLAALFYTLRNIVYAAASYPIGALSHRFSRSRYLAAGYAVAVVTFAGFLFAFSSIFWFAICFSLAGIFIAWEDTMERVAVRDYVDDPIAGTAFGLLGAVNGIGDFASSIIVGVLWTAIGPKWGFAYAAIMGLAGMILMAKAPPATAVSVKK